MDVFKLRLKIGVNEFEAEGSEEYIKGERQIFLESITAEENQDDRAELKEQFGKVPPVSGSGGGLTAGDASGAQTPALPIPLADMSRLATQDKSDKDLIVLTALPQDAETQKQDALLLLLLAHKVIRSVDNVKSTDALNGMKQSGLPVDLAAVADRCQLSAENWSEEGNKISAQHPWRSESNVRRYCSAQPRRIKT